MAVNENPFSQQAPAVLPYVDFNIPVDPGVWTSGVSLNMPPDAVVERSDRLGLLFSLFNGEWRGIAGEGRDAWPIQVNYFEAASTFYARLMLVAPPVVTANGQPLEDEWPDTVNSLRRALFTVIVDMFRYGTGLMRAGPMLVRAIDPRDWFPAELDDFTGEATADALVTIARRNDGTDRAIIDIDTPEGGTRVERLVEGSTLGEVVRTDTYDALPTRRLIVCPREPVTGEWGTSLFPKMAPMVMEMARRLSMTSAALDDHLTPFLITIPKQGQRPFPNPADAFGDDQSQAVQMALIPLKLGQWRQQPVGLAPDWMEDAKYVSWDAQLIGNNAHIAEIENLLFAATEIPAQLMGILRGPQSNSGVALRRLFAPAAATISEVQAFLLPQIKRVIENAYEEEAMAVPEIEVEWEHPFDAIDQASATMMQPQGQFEQPAAEEEEEDDDAEDAAVRSEQ